MEVVLQPAADAFLEVGAFVGVALLAFGILRWRTGDALTRWFDRHRRLGPVAGALLGAFPGCGGAIVVMPLYLRREVSFGTVVATLTATMGDSSFVLLAADPRLGVTVHLGLLVVGAVTGTIVDVLGYAPRRPDPTGARPVARRLGAPHTSTVGAAALPLGLTGRPTLHGVPWTLSAFWVLTATAFVVAVPVVFQLVPPERFDLGAVPTSMTLGLLGALSSIAVTAVLWRRGERHADAVCRSAPHDLREVAREAARETAQVTTWVVLAFVGYEALATGSGLDIGALPTLGLLGVLAGALLGLVPGCGPQIVLTGLYVQGALPLSVLAANALSQDGDALFPLLAADRRSALGATVVSTVPGLLVGGVLVALGS